MAEQDDALEQMLVEMVSTLTRSLIARELLTDSSHILQLVQSALSALPIGANNLTLYLGPDDLAMVEAYAEEQRKDWQFIGDSSLLPGGCRLETRESRVDFSMETRLEALLEQFTSKELSGGDEVDSDELLQMMNDKVAERPEPELEPEPEPVPEPQQVSAADDEFVMAVSEGESTLEPDVTEQSASASELSELNGELDGEPTMEPSAEPLAVNNESDSAMPAPQDPNGESP